MLQSLHESEIKAAYRKRALQTHPDRFASRGAEYQKRCSERFIAVNNAYETLSSYLKSRERGFDFKPARDPENVYTAPHRKPPPEQYRPSDYFRNRTDEFSSHFYWQKDVPHRHLRFGEFLYYSGVIPWKILIRALVWQVRQRPRIGEIAQRWRWLTEFQIANLLRYRHPGERLGELLLDNKIITPFQLKILLWQQKRLQKPIGEYFLDQRVLSESQIQAFLRRQESHNFKFRANRPGSF